MGRPERWDERAQTCTKQEFGDASLIKYMCMAFPRAVHCCGPGLYRFLLVLEEIGAFGEF